MLLDMFREAKASRDGDPVAALAEITGNPALARRYKVVVCSPDYSDAAKFADEWLSPAPGTDGALALAMGHVILREFLVNRTVPYIAD